MMPADPELDGTPLGASVDGARTVATLLGAMRAELRMQGFTKSETYALCEEWMKGTFKQINDDEDEDE
jgi:hypothetical protein